MKALIATSFYAEYELYETSDIDGLKDLVKRMANGESVSPDPAIHKLLGSQDDMTTQEAIEAANETIWIDEF